MNEDIKTTLKALIVESLRLEDVKAEEIVDDAPLFGDGLGLDSIDALEIAIVVEKKFGVRIRAEDEQNKQIFRSVNSLAQHIADNAAPAARERGDR